MTQSGTIAAFLLAAFVLFLAAKGRLGAYAAILWGPTRLAPPSGNVGGPKPDTRSPALPGGGSPGPSPVTGSSGGSTLDELLKSLETVPDLAATAELIP